MTYVTDDFDFFTIAEVADVLRISKSAVNRSIANGTFPVKVFKPTPRKALISKALLYQAMAGESAS